MTREKFRLLFFIVLGIGMTGWIQWSWEYAGIDSFLRGFPIPFYDSDITGGGRGHPRFDIFFFILDVTLTGFICGLALLRLDSLIQKVFRPGQRT